ncbi:hypothetical protein GCK72_022301 [Caenorhabditis remanei]|uniref:Uncharacterized protein n=1 Tax=Caenorhabditis remanei TaxID=31234 RepID=A0A6A5FTG7_CAERE|nr:hypothetical protein GCK72_022301 [Caenorhabditis remanei]KAF1745854.1 hypothetical protein GCK72_022301 [Caenorhabditis remanei]
MLEDSQHKGTLLLVMTADGLADVDKELLPSGNFRIEIGTGILCDVEHDMYDDSRVVTKVHGLTGWIVPKAKREFWYECPLGRHVVDRPVFQIILDLDAEILRQNDNDSTRVYSHDQLEAVLVPSKFYRDQSSTKIPIEVYKSPPFFHEWKTYDIENAILEEKEDEKCEVDAKITLELENYLLKCSNKKLVKQLRKDMTKIEELETNQRVGKFRVGTRAYRAKIRMTIQKYGQVENTANWSDSD